MRAPIALCYDAVAELGLHPDLAAHLAGEWVRLWSEPEPRIGWGMAWGVA